MTFSIQRDTILDPKEPTAQSLSRSLTSEVLRQHMRSQEAREMREGPKYCKDWYHGFANCKTDAQGFALQHLLEAFTAGRKWHFERNC